MISHEQRDVQYIIIQLQIIQREPHTELDLIREHLLKLLEALAGGIGLRLDLNRENVIFPLNEEIHFIRWIILAPIAGNHFKLRDQGLQHKVFSQSALELGEQAVALSKGRGSQLCQTAEQTHIHQINLKCRQVIVGSHRQAGSSAAVDLMHQSCIHQPLQSILVFSGSCAFFDNFVNKLLILPCQLGRYRLPDHNSTIFSDIVKRNQVRKIDQLERVVKYTFSNVGNPFSAKSISDYLKAEHRALDNETVYSYLEKLEKAYLLHRCSRFDLQGKEILKTQEKFYLADTALRYSILGYNADSVASSLENVVYLELCRRGYTVHVGKSGSGEIDFVAVRQNEKLYVQVTQEVRSEKTEKREYERLLEIHDNYPKYILTTDAFAGGNYGGIKTMHIADFLLSSEY